MNLTDQWHYTNRSGAQAGPVSRAELMQLVATNVVPANAVVWREGMVSWTPLAQVAELQPVTAAAAFVQPNAVIAPTASLAGASSAEVNPYTPPSAVEPTHPDFGGGAFEHVMEYGGIGRLSYFLQSIFYVIAGVIGIYAGLVLVSWIVALIIGLVLVVIIIRISALRLKNMGSSAWWLLLIFVPIGGTILQIMMQACPEGYSDHKKMDTPGIIVAVVLILLNILSFSSSFLDHF